MRKLRWLARSALCLLLALSTGAFARAAEEYTYTVRFYAGGQGTIRGEEVVEFTGLAYGDRVSFSARDVELKDSGKYYVKGIRESGRDNNTVGTNSFLVTKDQDYVVAYGILGNSVSYTIRYVDAAGRELAPSETYYGNVGDKPVVAYLYIDGYQPQAYNLTATLSNNAEENVFTFVYSGIVPSTPAPTRTPAPQNSPEAQEAEEAPSTPSALSADETEHPVEEAQTEEAQTEGARSEPEEVIDMDVPLAAAPDTETDNTVESGGEETSPRSPISWVGLIVGGSGLLFLLLLTVLLIRRNRKTKKDEPLP